VGPGALIEAAVRMPLIYSLPLDVMAGLSIAMQLGTIAVLTTWTLLCRKHRMDRAGEHAA
jgi:hypothetical protein